MGSRVIPAETSRIEGIPGVVPMGWKLEARVWSLGSNPSHRVVMTRKLWPGRVHKTPSQAHPGLGTRWGTYVFIVSHDTGSDLS